MECENVLQKPRRKSCLIRCRLLETANRRVGSLSARGCVPPPSSPPSASFPSSAFSPPLCSPVQPPLSSCRTFSTRVQGQSQLSCLSSTLRPRPRLLLLPSKSLLALNRAFRLLQYVSQPLLLNPILACAPSSALRRIPLALSASSSSSDVLELSAIANSTSHIPIANSRPSDSPW